MSDTDDDEELSPLMQGHEHASQAESYEKQEHWRSAINRHEAAAKCFSECLGLTQHPQANRALHLLIEHHRSRANQIKQLLGFDNMVHRAIQEQGYSKDTQCALDEDTYANLRRQIVDVISYITHEFKNIQSKKKEKHKSRRSRTDEGSEKKIDKDTFEVVANSNASSIVQSTIVNKPILVDDNYYKSSDDNEQTFRMHSHMDQPQTQEKLIHENQMLQARVQDLQSKLDEKNLTMLKILKEAGTKCTNVKVLLDDAYASRNQEKPKDSSGETTDTKVELLEQRIAHLKKREERHGHIFRKQNQELTNKLKEWVTYSKKLERKLQIYQKMHQRSHPQTQAPPHKVRPNANVKETDKKNEKTLYTTGSFRKASDRQ